MARAYALTAASSLSGHPPMPSSVRECAEMPGREWSCRARRPVIEGRPPRASTSRAPPAAFRDLLRFRDPHTPLSTETSMTDHANATPKPDNALIRATARRPRRAVRPAPRLPARPRQGADVLRHVHAVARGGEADPRAPRSRPSTPVDRALLEFHGRADDPRQRPAAVRPARDRRPLPPGRPRPHGHRRPLHQRLPRPHRGGVPGVPARRGRLRGGPARGAGGLPRHAPATPSGSSKRPSRSRPASPGRRSSRSRPSGSRTPRA